MNVPNSLTIARILMCPVLAIAMLPAPETALAATLFAAGMVTDLADGYLARSRGLITKLGTLLDPIADKLFVGTALVCLAATGRLAVWVVLVIFARDLLVTGLRLSARRRGGVIGANMLGKAKTVFQAFVVFVLVVTTAEGALILGLVYLMVAVTILSGAVYVHGYQRGRRIAVPRVAPRARVEARATLG